MCLFIVAGETMVPYHRLAEFCGGRGEQQDHGAV